MSIYILTKNNKETGLDYYEVSQFVGVEQSDNLAIEEWNCLDECETPKKAEELAQKYADKYGCEWGWK